MEHWITLLYVTDIYISRITSRLFVSCVTYDAHKMFEYNKKKNPMQIAELHIYVKQYGKTHRFHAAEHI